MTESEARQVLSAAGVAPSEARKLMRLADETGAAFRDLVQRRAAREPFSHLSGFRAFWKHRFRVTPDVLDPRPETERLVELALDEPFTKVLDLGTGTGCIVISLLAERSDAKGVGTDISEKGILIAGENAMQIGVADRLVLPLSDWFDDVGGRFDLIVSNPPYISADEMAELDPEVRDFEPRTALTDGADGLSAYRVIATNAPKHLKPNGRVLVEIGANQRKDVAALFMAAGLADVQVHTDMSGKDRVVVGRHTGKISD